MSLNSDMVATFHHFNLSYDEKIACIESADNDPQGARRCYRAIAKSLRPITKLEMTVFPRSERKARRGL